MRDNILVHDLPEEENKDLPSKVTMLIKEHLQLDVDFIRIYTEMDQEIREVRGLKPLLGNS
jgi:hypothetical protein